MNAGNWIGMKRAALILTSFGLLHCGPGPTEITVADHPTALTTNSGDTLFTLTLTKASKGYPLASISVIGGLPGQTLTVLNYTHADFDLDGELGEGEMLSVKEPVVNLFDSTTVGQAVTVSLDEDRQGTLYSLDSTTWTPTN
jgi:hypothetical protein